MRDRTAAQVSYASSTTLLMRLDYGGNRVPARPRDDEVIVRIRCLSCNRVLAHACGTAAAGMKSLGSHQGKALASALTGAGYLYDPITRQRTETIEHVCVYYVAFHCDPRCGDQQTVRLTRLDQAFRKAAAQPTKAGRVVRLPIDLPDT